LDKVLAGLGKVMNIVYLFTPGTADCDFPLIKAFQQLGHKVRSFMLLTEYHLHSTIIDIDKQLPESDILPATEYEGMMRFASYMDMSGMFIVNKSHRHDYHPCSLLLYLKLSRRISNINPDTIILSHPFGTASLPMLYKFRRKIQFVIHDPMPHSGTKSLRRSFFRWFCFRIGRKFVILNPNQLDEFSARHKIKKENIMIGGLGIYDVYKLFVSEGSNKPQPIKNNILFFGRIAQYKGIGYLCKAMEKVRERIPDATLTIAGNGQTDIYPELNDRKQYINLINRFVPVQEMASLFGQTSVVCCPYTDATQSGVVMTAFTFLKPVVATKVGGMESQIDDGKTGILVPPCDADALSDALVGILENQATQRTIAENIYYKYHKNDEQWRVIAQKYIGFSRDSD